MRIVQITDMHINSIGEDVRGNVDVRKNFQKVTNALKSVEFDLIIVSGDLCLNKGDHEVYQWIKNELHSLEKPYYVISGNHDDNTLMAETFNMPLQKGELYYEKVFTDKKIYFLDTSSYKWSKQQMEWLREKLVNSNDHNIIIFIHHPPTKSGVKFMDSKHPLENIEETVNFFKQFSDKSFYFFCGHCHVENHIQVQNLNVFITPSTYFQMKLDSENFILDHNIPGYRVINIEENRMSTNVVYIN